MLGSRLQQVRHEHGRSKWLGNTKLLFLREFRWCPGAELNHRHTDFQSVALPTELPGRTLRSHL
jgi:hypothetical protein